MLVLIMSKPVSRPALARSSPGLAFFASLFTLWLGVPGCRDARPKMQPSAPAAPTSGPELPGKDRILFYRSPMNPAQTAPVPSKDSMGMDYLPVYQSELSSAANGPAGFAPVTLDPQRQQLIGLKAVAVRQTQVAGTLRTIGRVTFDETRIHHVHTRYEAYVEQVYADFTGKFVNRGEPLASLYSPDLLTAEQEYLLALRAQKAESAPGPMPKIDVDVAESARQKLLLWNVRPADIEALAKSGVASQTLRLYAPISGYVVAKMAVHGMRVKPEDSLFDIVDLSRVWVLAQIYEYELPRIKLGQKATITLSYWPDRTWLGKIVYIFPSVDEKTRTIKVRIDVQNPKDELKAEMFADVVIAVKPHSALVVPDDAVIETGTRKIAFIVQPGGRLLPREVKIGDRMDGLDEVRSGLADGERVAVGASFLLDSESQLRAALSAMAPVAP